MGLDRRLIVMVALLTSTSPNIIAQAPAITFDQVQRVTEGGPSWTTSFGNVEISCGFESAREPITLADVLGSSVRALSVRKYHAWLLKTDDEVRDYVRTILAARPEIISAGQRWSELTPVNVVIVIEWEDGRFGRLDLGGRPNGGRYALLQDHRGCEW